MNLIKGIQINENRQDTADIIDFFNTASLFNFKGESKLSTWIGTIAYRHGINHLRKKKIELKDISEERDQGHHFIDTNNLSETLEDNEMNALVIKFITTLPMSCGMMFIFPIDSSKSVLIIALKDLSFARMP